MLNSNKISASAIRMVKSAKKVLVLQHAEEEGLATFADFFSGRGWSIRTINLWESPLRLGDMNNAAVIISMGGPMNVYQADKHPYLKDEEEFMQKVMAKNIPLLGICLGAQMLAKSCGAAVTKAPAKEVGWYDAWLTEAGLKDQLFTGMKQKFKVFQYHEDTFAIPQGAELLVTGETCANQAFRWGKNAYGLQFHPEVSVSIVEDWLRKPMNSGDKEFDYNAIIQASKDLDSDMHIQAFSICLNLEKITLEANV